MLENNRQPLCQLVSAERLQHIDHWIAKYPSEEKQSAVMAALMIVQEEHGYLTEVLMDAVAEYLEMPAIAVYEVASFYSMYEHSACGRNLVNVCTNISCKLRDADCRQNLGFGLVRQPQMVVLLYVKLSA
jgi:NADH-quinone oxidoreductase subunit E